MSYDVNKIYKEYSRAKVLDAEHLKDLFSPPSFIIQQNERIRKETQLNSEEKSFLLAVERGDLATVRLYLQTVQANSDSKLNINCVDPLGRSALLIAIEYENIEMIELLLSYHVQVGEALLHAINEEFVEAVEILLAYQDQEPSESQRRKYKHNNYYYNINNNSDSLYTATMKALQEEERKNAKASPELQAQIQSSKSFTPDITPLILASHKDNYEIIKILLDRGEQITEPHDVRCNCYECVQSRKEDSLRYSKSRMNAYKALASPSLISLSSKDPILTAFELSWELRRLSRIENEFKDDYEKLASSCQEYASALLAETRTSKELEVILNHDHENIGSVAAKGEKMSLTRLKLAIKYKQKTFVAHSHCQQLLVSLWYEGLPSFRRRNLFLKIVIIIIISFMFPFISLLYLLTPNSRFGKIARQPFIKFVCHSASYVTFLFLLILASQRIKSVINDPDENPSLASAGGTEKSKSERRGPVPTSIEWMIFAYVIGFVWAEIKQLYQEGIEEYLSNWWNFLDFITNALYIITIVLRLTAFIMVNAEKAQGKETAYYNREKWDPWDPTLISEGLFACANIFSSLKLVYIFTINPHLGPLQISLGRMLFDIFKFSVLIILVVFSFACGLNQLYWYYAQMKEQECAKEVGESLEECLLKIKYFSNLFETLQTLYWGTFGLVEKDRLEIHRKHTFTMFVGLLMFGVYCAIMIIILINMLIAMMSNSYQLIADQSDEEWKFARSKLWMSYFEGGFTLPVPFSLIPSPKSMYYIVRWFYHRICCSLKKERKQERWLSIRKVMKKISEREYKYQSVVKELVKRYIMRQQRRDRNAGVTEDDLNEIKQDISAFRFELLDIYRNNDYKVDSLKQNFANKVGRKRGKINLEKTISKNFFDTNSHNKMFEPFLTTINDEKLIRTNNNDNNMNDGYAKQSQITGASSSTDEDSVTKQRGQPFKSFKNTPTMYKVACKLRNLRGSTRIKKTELSTNKPAGMSGINDFLSEIIVDPKDMLASISLMDKSLISEEKPIIIPSPIAEDDNFTERITEV